MDKSRQQFEEWFNKNKSSTINLFDAWEASRERLEIELPDASDSDSGCPNYHDGYNTAMSRAYDELINNGAKIKND